MIGRHAVSRGGTFRGSFGKATTAGVRRGNVGHGRSASQGFSCGFCRRVVRSARPFVIRLRGWPPWRMMEIDHHEQRLHEPAPVFRDTKPHARKRPDAKQGSDTQSNWELWCGALTAAPPASASLRLLGLTCHEASATRVHRTPAKSRMNTRTASYNERASSGVYVCFGCITAFRQQSLTL